MLLIFCYSYARSQLLSAKKKGVKSRYVLLPSNNHFSSSTNSQKTNSPIKCRSLHFSWLVGSPKSSQQLRWSCRNLRKPRPLGQAGAPSRACWEVRPCKFWILGVTSHMAVGLWASPAPVLCWSLEQKTLCLDVFDPWPCSLTQSRDKTTAVGLMKGHRSPVRPSIYIDRAGITAVEFGPSGQLSMAALGGHL